MQITVSKKGQVTIPKRLRESLGLHAGTVLEFSSESGKLVARKKIDDDRLRKWRGHGKLPGGGSVDDYLKRVRDSGYLRDYFRNLKVWLPGTRP